MAKEKLFHQEINCETGEQIVREFTSEEYAQAESDAQAAAEFQAAEEIEAERIATLKASAIAKLVAGQKLTEEEAKTIIV